MNRPIMIAALAAALVGLSSTPARAQIAIGIQYDAPWAEPAPPPPAPPPPPAYYSGDPVYQPAAGGWVWIDGYQQWNGYRYVWYPGHWAHRDGWHRHHDYEAGPWQAPR